MFLLLLVAGPTLSCMIYMYLWRVLVHNISLKNTLTLAHQESDSPMLKVDREGFITLLR